MSAKFERTTKLPVGRRRRTASSLRTINDLTELVNVVSGFVLALANFFSSLTKLIRSVLWCLVAVGVAIAVVKSGIS